MVAAPRDWSVTGGWEGQQILEVELEPDNRQHDGEGCQRRLGRRGGAKVEVRVSVRATGIGELNVGVSVEGLCCLVLVQREEHLLPRVITMSQGMADLGNEKGEPEDQPQNQGWQA